MIVIIHVPKIIMDSINYNLDRLLLLIDAPVTVKIFNHFLCCYPL